MTESEVVAWLGLPPGTPLPSNIIEGMASVDPPAPDPTDDHVRVFTAFLRCTAPAPGGKRGRQAGES